MPTSAHWEAANLPQIIVKTVHTARADVYRQAADPHP